MSEVELRIGGQIFTGWERVELYRSVESPAGRFALEVSDPKRWRYSPGSEVSLSVDGLDLLSGFLDRATISEGGNRGTRARLEGRDKTGDLVDSSAVHESGSWANVDLIEIAQDLATPHEIEIVSLGDPGAKFGTFAIQPSETVWESISRAMRLRGLLAWPDEQGRLQIGKPGGERADVALVQGKNLLESTFTVDDTQRFNQYIVRGQQPLLPEEISGLWGAEQLAAPEGSAIDDRIRGNRVLVVLAEGAADDAICELRALWEASTRAAVAAPLVTKVQGWHQGALDSSPLWSPGLVATTRVPRFGISQDMLVRAVRMEKFGDDGGQGETTELELVGVGAYERPPGEDDPAQNIRDWHGWDQLGVGD